MLNNVILYLKFNANITIPICHLNLMSTCERSMMCKFRAQTERKGEHKVKG